MTPEGAKRYGVVASADGAIDREATTKLRAELTQARGDVPHFDFGPSIAQLKATCVAETGLQPPETPRPSPIAQAWFKRQGQAASQAEFAQAAE